MAKITTIINEDGSTQVDFHGYQGTDCMDADEKLRKALAAFGVTIAVTAFEEKPELHEAGHTVLRQTQQEA